MTGLREPRVLSVAELNRYASRSLSADPILRSLSIRGEISGFKPYPSGWYFDLKDEDAKISCVMWRDAARRMSFVPANGQQVILHGSAGIYERSGQFQFVADLMRPEGTGRLWERYEQLKEKLRAEGLFDEDRKRPLPLRPRRIAVVTSAEGAVWHDIHKISRERDPGVALVLVPVHVQGDAAAPEIAAAIPKAAALPEVDLLIVGRGGGSMQDLWCFNEECVARAIAASPIPVISAVGHETDFTIADFVADRRASTPSNAAELAVQDRSDAAEALDMIRDRLTKDMRQLLSGYRLTLSETRRRITACSPEATLQRTQAESGRLRVRLDAVMDGILRERRLICRESGLALDRAAEGYLEHAERRAERLRTRLEAISPLRVLGRGYALVLDGNTPVTSAVDAPRRMTLRFADGSVQVRREEEAET